MGPFSRLKKCGSRRSEKTEARTQKVSRTLHRDWTIQSDGNLKSATRRDEPASLLREHVESATTYERSQDHRRTW